MLDVPKYSELPLIGKRGDRHTWDVFGRGDNLGTLNFISPESIVSAANNVTTGKVINLSLPLDVPSPSLSGSRAGYRHEVFVSRQGRDDKLDNFFLQASSQWDSLRHIRYREFGYYGGREEEDLDSGNELGIDHMARRGVVGRGVLVDMARYFEEKHEPIRPTERFGICPSHIEEVLRWERVECQPGDILLLRTGWLAWYLSLSQEERGKLAGSLHNGEGGLECPGLESGQQTPAWLWDHQIAAIAADNPALEALRVDRELGFLHRMLIPLLGMPIGEFWFLEELSDYCYETQRYEFLLVSAPLNLPKGVGSPSNAYAIF